MLHFVAENRNFYLVVPLGNCCASAWGGGVEENRNFYLVAWNFAPKSPLFPARPQLSCFPKIFDEDPLGSPHDERPP